MTIAYWVIPPKADSEFAASMEQVLDAYARPYDSRYPVLCMDEQPIQSLKETREPIAGTKEHPRRVDYEYERAGTATRQYVTGRQFATIKDLREQTTAWHECSNARQRGVDWQFKVGDARVKLKSIYPKLEV
jgi:hypothetical protein